MHRLTPAASDGDTNPAKRRKSCRKAAFSVTHYYYGSKSREELIVDGDGYLVSRDVLEDVDVGEWNVDREWRVVHLFMHPQGPSVPNSIGQLHYLKELKINSDRITSLPLSIGRLRNLKIMHIICLNMISLPPTIGQLQNLENFGIGSGLDLRSLPDEIGDLARLKELWICMVGIRSLPSSIGRLQNLKFIHTSFSDLTELPEDIGNVINLDTLVLSDTRIAHLPDTMGRLAGLTTLVLKGVLVPEIQEGTDPTEYLSMLLQRCQSLLCLGRNMENMSPKIGYALACRRARMRAGFGGLLDESPELWPWVLSNAPRASEVSKAARAAGWYGSTNVLEHKPDAIYRFLEEDRESFLCSLMHRRA